MTHGEQTKAKAAKTSQASGNQKSSKTGGKALQTGKSSKAGGKEGGGEAGKTVKIVAKKDQTGAEKSSAASQKAGSSAKETGNGGKGAAKGRTAPEAADGPPGFSNPAVANAFKRAVKKYSNAFRKLTD